MTEITALLVKELREKSGAGMLDCKHALTEKDGDIEAAIDWLRTKGLAAAAKKAGRVAAEGLVAVATNENAGAIVEVNSETDFVARNPEFQTFVSAIAELALISTGDFEKTMNATMNGNSSVEDSVIEMVGTIGENLNFRRSAGITVKEGVVASYVHSATAPNMGRIGVLIGLESTGDTLKLTEFGKQLAMHVAATNPQWISPTDVDARAVSRERDILAEQARQSGKPEEIVQKMVDGRMRKYFEEVCLLEQTFVIDGETKVADALDAGETSAGAPITIVGFSRFQLGEGVDKDETDFAAEVAATVSN